jgi:acyl-CoA synthetase (AMP-forming)/AMP-acid ligase II
LLSILQDFEVSHCLCTPTLWGSVMASAIPNPNSAPSSSFGPTHPGPHLVPRLRVLALGGVPIPPPLIHAWARPPLSASSACAAAVSSKPAVPTEAADAGPRLLATYGVTEACVYQTLGEVFRGQGDKGAAASGHSVGRAFAGVGVRICDETVRDRLLEALPNDNGVRVGEIVLYGNQVDEYHSYLHQPGLSKVFLRDECGRFCYRTGMFSVVAVRNVPVAGL